VTTFGAAIQIKPMITVKRLPQASIAKDMSKSQIEPPTFAMVKDVAHAFAEQPPNLDTKLKDDENPTKPFSIGSVRDFEDMSQDMHRLFEGKETEQNWDKRRKAIIKLSRITHGNGPIEYRAQYAAFIKSQLDCILKVVDSLRTNVSTAGLSTLQHIADTLGHGIDYIVDFVAETLIARSCNTSKVKRDPAVATFETIISNATCNKNLLHYIMSASEHKDPNARTAVSTWLTALLTKNGRHCDQAGIPDIIEKCIKNGLNDAKPQVRTPMRTTYGAYAKLFPDRAERLRDSLDLKTQKMLDANLTVESTHSSMKRPSIRDIKAAKKKELEALEASRAESTQSNRPSIKDVKAAKMRETKAKDVVRPPSAQSTRPAARDAKMSKKRDVEGDDAARPLSAHSNRPLIKETKIVKRRDADAEDIVRPPSAQSTNTTRKRDMEARDGARPLSAQLHGSKVERRFQILMSAPVRPPRPFVDLKRVAPKSGPNLQHQADAEPATPLHLDDHRRAKQPDKRGHAPKNTALPSHEGDVSQQEFTTAKAKQLDFVDIETRIKGNAATTSAEIEPTRPKMGHRRAVSDVSAVLIDDDKRLEKHNDGRRNGQPISRHDRTQSEKHIEIHEDEAPRDQVDHAKASRVTKRRSADRIDILKDVATVSSKKGSTGPPSPPTVLREIDQLNQTVEPVRRQENTRQKYISTEAAERNRSVSPHNKNPEKAKKQLSRAIEKIRARTMDDYGYRRLQGLIKMHDTLFQDEQKYDELLLALLDTLETPNTENRQPLGRQYDNKFQILVTIRLMLVHNAKYCAAYHPRALSALITARRNFESRCHIVGGLEETAEDILAACTPMEVIDPILDVLELQEHDDAGYRAILMGLNILSGLVARVQETEFSDRNQEERLTRFALKCLRNENSETRRATIAFCVELRRLINPEEKYFQMVAGNDEALKSLLTYFIATTRRR
jgi:CLIP-associating protein 1/2